MDANQIKQSNPRRSPRLMAGIILILLGAVALLQRWANVDSYATLLLGLGMLAWGSAAHKGGWIIPGGVLGGIGLGILILSGPWHIPAELRSGVFLLCFALGWFSIAVLTALFARPIAWPLIPGGIMALIGGILLVTNGGIPASDWNLVLAAGLISIGVVLIFFKGRDRKNG
jgi:hypothetical protein